MAFLNIQNVCLTSTSNAQYCQWCREHRQRTSTHRTPDPFAQDYDLELRKWEKVVQALVAESVPSYVSDPILYFQHRIGRGNDVKQFLELDFVSGTDVAPKRFVEIKLRQSTEKGTSGWPQLNRSLGVAAVRWPEVRGLSINVAMGDVLKTEPVITVSPVELRELPNIIEHASGEGEPTIWLRGSDVAEFAVHRNLLSVEDVIRLPELREVMLNPSRVLEESPVEKEMPRLGLFDRFRKSD